MQWRILFSSLVDNIEHTEAFELVNANEEDGIKDVVDETVDEFADEVDERVDEFVDEFDDELLSAFEEEETIRAPDDVLGLALGVNKSELVDSGSQILFSVPDSSLTIFSLPLDF